MAVYFIEENIFSAFKMDITLRPIKPNIHLKTSLFLRNFFILRILNSKANIRMTIKRKSEGDGSTKAIGKSNI